MTGTKNYKPDFTSLTGELRQTKLSYEACIQAMRNNKYDEAVKLQLLAIDSLNEFNSKLLRELEYMRRGKGPRKVWAP